MRPVWALDFGDGRLDYHQSSRYDPGFQAELIQLMVRTARGETTRQEVAAFLRQRML